MGKGFHHFRPRSLLTRILRSHFGVFGLLTCTIFARSAFSEGASFDRRTTASHCSGAMGCSVPQLAWREYVKALKKVAHEIGERSKPGSDKCQQNRTPTPDLRLGASST